MGLQEEINRRRTFAIVSHPDAGKTTLTEKLLLFGGAIRVAGAVKNNKIKQGAASDFMEIERQRGISVATSVMGFEYEGYKVNILDTPGHQDFQEDTFRTLTAVDSVIIVIDAAKGVEPQTERLMKVCRMRKTPVMVYINKMDRPTGDMFDLLDEIEEQLKIKTRPLSWPINSGADFKGVYNIFDSSLRLFDPSITEIESAVEIDDLSTEKLDELIGDDADTLREEVELIEGVYPEFDHDAYLAGNVAPVFFGSALYNFGVQELLDSFVRIAPFPKEKDAEERVVMANEPKFTGFIFKIHANIDPNHRSRIAFVKICSGKFERNKNYRHMRLAKNFKFSSPTAFMASKKETIEEAYPGDIIGIPDTGNFIIGDTLTEGENLHYKGMPSFSPEMFRYIENADPMKAKQLAKGVDQLMEEGVAQLFTNQFNGRKIIGCVGQLQFEVIEYRLEHEYGAKCRFESLPMYKACWIEADDPAVIVDFKKRKYQKMAVDKQGRDVFMADSSFLLQMAQTDFKDIRFHFTSEF
ncbi:peptide chain release factor 3 [Halosquirtibacter xylanolyticus]|uniref:peptide chain release factor 3 n=1 Tax=Halosquirtibacter xylanolyticus TaxID=3374599 RepID=UPI0037497D92|nr:peptide chain release factor 3 [Prolixibacteraceae bacterium]